MSDPCWRVRIGTPTDLPAVESIEQASFSDPWSSNALLQELVSSPLRLPLVAVDERDEPVGYLMAWRSADQLHILNLAVAPAHRRRTIATGLLQAALHDARRHRLFEVTLEVRPGNEAAINLYRAFGFASTGRRHGYYADVGEDALILTLVLIDH
jgi:[ribosomal protein S18]-alanine N-acetyltransferase